MVADISQMAKRNIGAQFLTSEVVDYNIRTSKILAKGIVINFFIIYVFSLSKVLSEIHYN